MVCKYCNKVLPEESLVCGYCGKRLKEDEAKTQKEWFRDNKLNFKIAVPKIGKLKYKMLSINSFEEEQQLNKDSTNDMPENNESEVTENTANTVESVEKIQPNDETASQSAVNTNDIANVAVGEQPVQQEQEKPFSPWQDVPRKFRPVRTAGFFFTELLLFIPILNIILLIFWAFRRNSNQNRKAYARSILLWIILFMAALLCVLIALIIMNVPLDYVYWLNELRNYLNTL